MQSSKLWLIKHFGTFAYRGGRWYRYSSTETLYRRANKLQTDGLFEAQLFGDLSNIVIVDTHVIRSSRSLFGLFQATDTTINFPQDTRTWIECSKTNLYRPGMDFAEVTKDFKGTLRVVVHEFESLLDLPLDGVELLSDYVSFSDPKEAMVFKLSHT